VLTAPPSSSSAHLLQITADDPEYRRMAAAEAAYWQNAHPWSLEEIEREHRPGLHEQFVNRRFTGKRYTHWSVALSRWGTFQRGLVLGTSALKWEARILATNPGLHLTFVDISAGAVGRRLDTLGKRFPGRVAGSTEDLNFIELPDDTYDLVVSSSTVHHVTNLEHLGFQVNRTLTATGRFFLEDYVGEARFVFSEAKKRLFEALYHRDLARQRARKAGVRWMENTDLSPFCGVRSDEILEVFRTYLDEVEVRTSASLAGLVVRMQPVDFEVTFNPSRWKVRLARWRKRLGVQSADLLGRRFVNELFTVGDIATQAGIVRPGVAFAIYRKRG
jgi:SAM-dependent methyltransferase